MTNFNERRVAEQALPATMLFFVMERLHKEENYELRKDISHALNLACITPLSVINDDLVVSRVARRVERDAEGILKDANCVDLRATLLACAYMTLGLVAEGRLKDQDNNAVLVSLALTDEAENDSGDEWGIRSDEARRAGKRMMDRAMLLGYYVDLSLADLENKDDGSKIILP